jgi:hypothetical protein
MASATPSVDRYSIAIDNYTDGTYQKNGSIAMGGYINRTAYCWQMLVYWTSGLGISAGSTVTDVTFDMNFDTVAADAAAHNFYVYAQNHGTWTDTGSAPVWNTFDLPASPALWDTTLSTTSLTATVGTKSIPSNAATVAHVQSYVDGTYPAGNYKGLIFGYDTAYFGYKVTVSSVTMTITYTSGGTTRRRIIIM